MNIKNKLAAGASLLASTLLMPVLGHAAVITGSVYEVAPNVAGNVDNFAGGTPVATFEVSSPSNPACTGLYAGDTLCFHDTSSDYTLGNFLTSGGATILTGSSHSGDSGNNLVLELKGNVTVSNGESFVVGHDDGLNLWIGGIEVLHDPGPTSPTLTTYHYSGPSGTFGFDLVYGECCGPPAELATSLPLVSTPEPSSLALLALGLFGVGFAASRRRRLNG